MTPTPCMSWHKTLHYITKYPLPVPVYSALYTHTHTHTHTHAHLTSVSPSNNRCNSSFSSQCYIFIIFYCIFIIFYYIFYYILLCFYYILLCFKSFIAELYMRPQLSRFYHNNTLLYYILSF